MDSISPNSKTLRPLLALLLTIATLCLCGPPLLLWLLSAGGGRDEATFYSAVGILKIGVWACPVGAILLVIYALLDGVWKKPLRRAWFFWLLVLVGLVMGAKVAAYFYGEWQTGQQRTAEQQVIDHAAGDQQQMQHALLTDDVKAFSVAYKACDIYCSRLPWLRKAITAEAPLSLSVLLKSETAQSYASDLTNADHGGICRDGAYYEGYYPLAGQVGATGNLAMIDLLLPLWSHDDVQQAFYGAAFGNHVDTMKALVAYGANPRQPIDENPIGDVSVDDAITAAMSSGSVDSLQWLAEQNVRPGSDREKNLIWVKFGEWVDVTPSNVWTVQLDAMLNVLERIGVSPTHNASEPLWHAVDSGNAVLARALLRHGALAKDLSQDVDRQAKLQTLLAGPPGQLGNGGRVQNCTGSAVN